MRTQFSKSAVVGIVLAVGILISGCSSNSVKETTTKDKTTSTTSSKGGSASTTVPGLPQGTVLAEGDADCAEVMKVVGSSTPSAEAVRKIAKLVKVPEQAAALNKVADDIDAFMEKWPGKDPFNLSGTTDTQDPKYLEEANALTAAFSEAWIPVAQLCSSSGAAAQPETTGNGG